MRDRRPALVTVACIALVAAGAAAFVLRPASAPAQAKTVVRNTVPPVSAGGSPPASLLTASVASESTQSRVAHRTRPAHASRRRAADPLPPAYLLRQGITRVRGTGRRVAITFDDGPSANTGAVLGILTRYRSHATFFMVGRRVEAAPQLARAVLEQGSEIGNHTLTHAELWRSTIASDEAQITGAEAIIHEATGVRPRYVRPKGGEVDDNGIRAIERLGKRYVYWDVAGFDTVPTFSAGEIRDAVLERVRPGSVIVLHETNPRTVEALPEILAGLHRRGYVVDDLTRLLRR